MCTGDKKNVEAEIFRLVARGGHVYQGEVHGGAITAVIGDRSVLQFASGASSATAPVTEKEDWWVATFDVKAMSAGTTTITFSVDTTGEETTLGRWPTRGLPVTINVVDCYRAYTSGLGSVFTVDEMGDLQQPFGLAAHTPGTDLKIETQFMFFIPNPQDGMHGHYAFVDTATALTGTRGSCTAYVSGHYSVVFHGPVDAPVEGDLEMSGVGTYDCQGYTVPINYSAETGFLVAFKPAR
jgi:hypothetical protein